MFRMSYWNTTQRWALQCSNVLNINWNQTQHTHVFESQVLHNVCFCKCVFLCLMLAYRCVFACVSVCLCVPVSIMVPGGGPLSISWQQALVPQPRTTDVWCKAPPYGHRTGRVYVWQWVRECVSVIDTKSGFDTCTHTSWKGDSCVCLTDRDVCAWPLTSGYVSQLCVHLRVCDCGWGGAARLSSISHTPGQHLTLGLQRLIHSHPLLLPHWRPSVACSQSNAAAV